MTTKAAPQKIPVMVAVPSVDGNVNFSIAGMFAWAMRASADPAFPFSFGCHVEPGVRPIEYARNRITKKFMAETAAEWLLMIDADQVVPQNFWEILAVANADIVSGLTYTWMGAGEPQTMLRVNQYGVDGSNQCFNLTPPDGAIATKAPYFVPVIGTGCIAIRRKVFEKMGDEPWYFTRLSNGKTRGGEDINFSVEASRHGFTIAVHPGVVFGHVKPIDITQIASFYQARHDFDCQGFEATPAQMLSIG